LRENGFLKSDLTDFVVGPLSFLDVPRSGTGNYPTNFRLGEAPEMDRAVAAIVRRPVQIISMRGTQYYAHANKEDID
jgi:hypothetical protein